jgi:TonB-dependent SusC/RagA subfamily outer membrane receptor
MKCILGFSLCFIMHVVAAQTNLVTGKLTTFGVFPVRNIIVESSKAGSKVQTDSLGVFNIVCFDKDVIKIKSKVFESVTFRIKGKTDTLKHNLVFIETDKNRQLAVGYGYISRENLTFAISNLSYENNDFCRYNDIFELIKGRFAGVTVSSDGAGAGGKKQVIIRGVNSLLLSSEALYVVDGMVVNDISFITPCEIKEINVLKDGSAAIYGAQGSNGVVVIETKK